MVYIESPSTDPYFNLALEQHVFDNLDRGKEYFMLWQNHNTIVVGKYQNTAREINHGFVKEKEIQVVRRLSGGGAVYHDMGNLNFTFIANAAQAEKLNFAIFIQPIVNTLAEFGVKAEMSGRNDITIDGKKFSGNSQYIKQKRVMHHGTILYSSDLSMVAKALNVAPDKIKSKGVQSVRSRVTNVKDCMQQDISLEDFKKGLLKHMFAAGALQPYILTEDDYRQINELKASRYDLWDWNYGASPEYSIEKKRRIEGCGSFTLLMEVEKGRITAFKLQGDFFVSGNLEALEAEIIGQKLQAESLEKLRPVQEVENIIRNLTAQDLLWMILE